MSEGKKQKQQYAANYIKYGFFENPTNPSLPLCLLCQKTFSNEAMKPSRLQDHLSKMHSNKKNKTEAYFQELEKKYVSHPTITGLFQ